MTWKYQIIFSNQIWLVNKGMKGWDNKDDIEERFRVAGEREREREEWLNVVALLFCHPKKLLY